MSGRATLCESEMRGSHGVDKVGLDTTYAMKIIDSSRDPLRNCEVEAEAIRGWLAQVPEGIQKAKKRAEDELQRREKDIESMKKWL